VQDIFSIKPYSPPFGPTMVLDDPKEDEKKKSRKQISLIKGEKILERSEDSEEKNELEVVFDPVLNCYYHPKTNSYFELKE